MASKYDNLIAAGTTGQDATSRARALVGKYDSFLSEDDREAAQANVIDPPQPDLIGRAKRYEKQLGVPASVVQAAPESFDAQARKQKVASILDRVPTLAQILANRDKAGSLYDDLDESERLAKSADIIKTQNWQQRVGTLFGQGVMGLYAGLLRLSNATSRAQDALIPEFLLSERTRQIHADVLAANSRDAAAAEQYASKQIEGATTWEAVKARPTPYNVAKFMLESTIQSVPGTVAAVAASPAFIASAAGSIGQQRAQNDGRAEATMGDIGIAAPFAAGSAALERLGIERIFGAEGANFMTRIVKAGAGEATTEFLQGTTEYLGGTVGTKKGADPAEALDQAFAGTVAGFGMGSGLRGVHEVASGTYRAATGFRDANVLDTIMDSAAKHNSRTRDPDTFREFVASQTDGTPAENVYIPVEAIDTLLQSDTVPESEKAQFEQFAEQINEARATSGDVVIPVADAATIFAGTQSWEALKEDARLAAGGLSLREAREQAGEVEQTLQQRGEEIANAADGDAEIAPAVQVYNEVRQQLIDAGFTENAAGQQAALFAANRETWGSRLGMTAAEYHAANPVEFRRELAGMASTDAAMLDQGENTATVNIGLAVPGGGSLSLPEVMDALASSGVSVSSSAVHVSDTEPTLVAQLSRPLTPEEGDALSRRLGQESIAQQVGEEGSLFGPMAAEWGPFNPAFFLRLDGLRADSGLPAPIDAPPLDGLPATSPGPFAPARWAALRYSRDKGIAMPTPTQYAKVDRARAERIAAAYDAMPHAPNDPEVRAAYEALVRETLEQWRYIERTGLAVEFAPAEDPYAGNPWGAVRDVRGNNHMYVFNTEDGYGQGGITEKDEAENPMLAIVPDLRWSGRPVRVNDVFRAVHDYFGHIAEGVGFRAGGEENAWRMHSAMFSREARRALTTETRGQNSWLNYGPHGETNRTASVDETVFAEQKIGLLPDWVAEDGVSDIAGEPMSLESEDTIRVLASEEIAEVDPEVRDKIWRETELKNLRVAADGTILVGARDQWDVADRMQQRVAPLGARIVETDSEEWQAAQPAQFERPPVDADGKITLQHFSSRDDLTVLDPTKWGTNASFLPPSERALVGVAPGRTYFGIATGRAGGYVNEFGPGMVKYEARIDANALYDAAANPEGFTGSSTERDQQVIAAGYLGYWMRDPRLGLVAVVFSPTEVARVDPEGAQAESAVYQQSPDGEFPIFQTANPVELRRELAGMASTDAAMLDQDSDAFRQWFGDSKAVDKTGAPAVVFHGTGADISAFDGMTWVSADPALAGEYADFRGLAGGDPNVMPVYVRAENVFDADVGLSNSETVGSFFNEVLDQAQQAGRDVDIPRARELLDTIRAAASREESGPRYARHDFWNDTVTNFGRDGAKAIADLFSLLGFDSVRMTENGAVTYGVFNPDQVKSVFNRGTFEAGNPNLLEQTTGPGPRGQVQFMDDGRAVVTLFETADMSTLLHETGHIFFEELKRNALRADAPADVKADWNAIKAWLKANGQPVIKDRIPREGHELMARGFERYLMEGKAPSRDLAGPFAAFRSWLLRIYQVVQALRSPITPEVRGVFDRMLATQMAIDAYTEQQGLVALDEDAAAQIGMTAAEFNAYRERVINAKREAYDTLLKKTMADIRARETARYREAKAGVTEDVTREVYAEPRFIALRLLRTGRWLNDASRPPLSVKLDRAWLLENFGADAEKQLPKGPMLVKNGGDDADYIAEQVGFSSGREMVEALIAIEAEQGALRASGDKRQLMDKEIDDRVAAELASRGDAGALSDGSIEEEALAAVNNAEQGEVLATELRYLARRTRASPTPYRLAREWAARKIRAGRVQDVASRAAVQRYSRAAAKSARLAEEAIIAGNYDEAFRQKQAHMLNHALTAEAKAAADEIDTIVKRMRKLADRAAMKSVDQDYMDRVHELLEKYDFRAKSQKWLREQEGFARWAAGQAAAGYEVLVPDRLLGDGEHYTKVSVDTLYGLNDAVASLLRLGRLKQSIVDAQEERAFNDYVDEIVGNLSQLPDRRLTTAINDKDRWSAGALAGLVKVETIADVMDRGNALGPMNRLLVERATQAENRREELRRTVSERIAKAYFKLDGKARKRLEEKVTVPEWTHKGGELDPRNGQPVSMTRMEMLSIALNTGNASNLEKLSRGEGWPQAAIDRVLRRELSKGDWDFVQDIWDAVDSLWPAIAETERNLSGVVPEKVDARPIDTPFGEYRGGYYPMVYDPNRSNMAERNADNSANDMFGMASGVGTPKGHTITRTGAVAPVLRSIEGVLFGHIERVVTRIAYAEYARDVMRVITNPRVRNAMDLKVGREYRRQIKPWLQRQINGGQVDPRGLGWWERFARSGRTNMSMVAMGFRWSTGVAQLAGLTASAGRIGPVALADGIRRMVRNPKAATEFVFERSPEMAARNESMNREVAEFFRSVRGKNNLLNRARGMAFWHIGMIDRYVVAVPTWLGAHAKAINEGKTDAEASAIADKAVRQSQGSGREKDLSNWQSPPSEPMRWLTLFYTYFNVQLNAQWEAGQSLRRGDWRKAAMLSFWFLVAAPLADALLSGDIPDPDDEDNDSWAGWFARNIFYNLWAGVPVARDVAAYSEKQQIGQYATLGSTPVQRVEEVAADAWRVGSKFATEGELDDRWVKTAIETPGYFMGLPTGQPAATGQFLWDYSNGETDPKGFEDWYIGLTKGKVPRDDE